MSIEEFKSSLKLSKPSCEDPILLALWYDGKGDWHKAHSMIDSLDGKNEAWVHAYLHRKEGDLSNASYWYRRAGKPVAKISLDEEWEVLLEAFIERRNQ